MLSNSAFGYILGYLSVCIFACFRDKSCCHDNRYTTTANNWPSPSLLSPLSSDGSASQVQQQHPNSQVLWPDEAVCLRKKKRHPRQDPFARLSALKDDLCHRHVPEDQTAILNSVDHDDSSGHATLL